MRSKSAGGLAGFSVALVFIAAVGTARSETTFGLSGPGDDLPSAPPAIGRGFGLDGPEFGDPPPRSRNKPIEHRRSEMPPEEAPPPQLTHKQMLDRLFDRLAKSNDPNEAAGVAALIERFWMNPGSDTADLLMSRAERAMATSNRDVALTLLDKIIALDPDWAEAWNKRATLRFLEHDDAGAMEDISHTLALEPRHFGALSGMGFILKRNGLEKGALAALRRAQSIYPENPDIRKAVDQLAPEVEGTDL